MEEDDIYTHIHVRQNITLIFILYLSEPTLCAEVLCMWDRRHRWGSQEISKGSSLFCEAKKENKEKFNYNKLITMKCFVSDKAAFKDTFSIIRWKDGIDIDNEIVGKRVFVVEELPIPLIHKQLL